MKPAELIERFIELSSNENGVVLDPFIGSGTAAIACMNTNRNYIGFELDEDYYEAASKRISKHAEDNIQTL